MKNKLLSLLFASFLVISGCETIGGSSSSSDSPSYEYGIQNKLIFKVIFKTKLEIEFTLKQTNTILIQLQPSH